MSTRTVERPLEVGTRVVRDGPWTERTRTMAAEGTMGEEALTSSSKGGRSLRPLGGRAGESEASERGRARRMRVGEKGWRGKSNGGVLALVLLVVCW